MAYIRFRIPEDALMGPDWKNTALTGYAPADLIGPLAGINGSYAAITAAPGMWVVEDDIVTIDLGNGEVLRLNSVEVADPAARSGLGVSYWVELLRNGEHILAKTGENKFEYAIDDGVLTLVPLSEKITDAAFGHLALEGLGIVDRVRLNAVLTLGTGFDGTPAFIGGGFDGSGSFNQIELVRLGVPGVQLKGDFQIHADSNAVQLSGTLNYLRTGSLDVRGDYRIEPGESLMDALFSSRNLMGDDDIELSVPVNMPETVSLHAGDGNDRIVVTMGSGALSIDAGSGNDRIELDSGGHALDGGAGIDKVDLVDLRALELVRDGAAWKAIPADGSASVTLTNVERVSYWQHSVALDIDGHAGQAYRLYTAVLGRTPDKAGLGYWMDVLDKGASLQDVAGGFMQGDEFVSKFGANASDETFITKLYENVLHRAPDDGGYRFWLDSLDVGVSRTQVMIDFSESAENQAQVIGAIGNGIEFTPYYG